MSRNDDVDHPPRQKRPLLMVAKVALVVFVLLPGLALLLLCGGLIYDLNKPIRERGVASPKEDFETETGLAYPANARLLTATDSHFGSGPALAFGPGMLDGTLRIVFECEPATLEGWLSQAAPWGATWQEGPLPELIHERSGLEEDFSSVEIRFAFRERGGPRAAPLEYWDGDLLVLHPPSGRVWLASWDK